MNLRRVQNLNRRALVRRLADLSEDQEPTMPAAWWVRALEQGERRALPDRRNIPTRQQTNNATH